MKKWIRQYSNGQWTSWKDMNYLKNVSVPGQIITLTKADGTTSKVSGYTVTPNNAKTNTWHKLGTFNNKTQGAGGEIWLFGGNGQNSAVSQNMWAHLFIKKGYQGTTPSTTNYVAASYEVFTPPSKDANYKNVKFKVFCTEIGVVDVWVYFPFPYSRAYYYPAGQYDSFTVANTEQTEEPIEGDTYGVEQPCKGGIIASSSNGTSIDDVIKSLSVSGRTITYTKGNGTTGTLITQDTTYSASTTTPKANGTASVGNETAYARGDHVHPSQTTISGNAGTATKLQTARNIKLTGAVTGQASFDGSANISINTTMQSGLSGMPIGSGCDYYGQTAPEGFLFADGSAISRTEYSELFKIIGTLYGAGDGSTTFNLPDKRKRMSVMLESEDTAFNTLGKTGGSVNHILTKAELPDYTLYSKAHAHSGVVTSVSASKANTWDVNKTTSSVTSVSSSKGNSASTTITIESGGSGEAINIMNPYLVCNYIIKAK